MAGRMVIGRPHGWRSLVWRALQNRFEDRWPAPADPPAEPPASAPPSTAPAGLEVCSTSALVDGEIAEFLVDGQALAVARIDGLFYAVDNTCPHAGGPLGDGMLEDHVVLCPWHGWGFDVRTGGCTLDIDLQVATFPLTVADGRVWLDR